MRLAALAVAATNLFAIGNDATRLAEQAQHIAVAAPNWYAVDAAGRVRGGDDAAYGAVAAGSGTPVWPVVNAQLGFRGGWLRARPDAVARQVASIARDHDGVTLDIEEIPPRLRARYSAFVADVVRRAARGGAADGGAATGGDRPGVAVYVVRRTAAKPLRSAAAYDWTALSRSADLVLASAYGEHSRASLPGPLTTSAGLKRVLAHARTISTERVAPVLAGFGIAWPLFGGGATIVPALSGPRGFAIRNGAQIYYEPARQLRAQRAAAARAGFDWVALFSLGREPQGFWPR